MYWAELKCKTRSVETWRRQYLTRHVLDLWYIFTVRAVSARAEKVLNLVRDWQRSEWDGWLARFLYLRDKALAVAVLNAWVYEACMPALADTSEEGEETDTEEITPRADDIARHLIGRDLQSFAVSERLGFKAYMRRCGVKTIPGRSSVRKAFDRLHDDGEKTSEDRLLQPRLNN